MAGEYRGVIEIVPTLLWMTFALIVGTQVELEAWRTRPLAEQDVFGLYLDAIALRVRSAGRVVSLPVLAVVGIQTDGQKQLIGLECGGGESFDA
jgi:transposase-like protein